MSARHCRRQSRRRDGGASQKPTLTIASSSRSSGCTFNFQLLTFQFPEPPRGEGDRLEVLVALQSAGQCRGASGGQVEIASRWPLVAPGGADVFPMRAQVAE